VASEAASVVIVGAGFSGLGLARRLQLAGVDDVVILERADEIGGTWRDNTYPGCGCDVRSHLYSWSFELNPDWSRRYALQPEIQTYVLRCVERWGLRPRIRLGADVVRAAFDEGEGTWTVDCADGRSFRARFFVGALGALRDPRLPDVPGVDAFEGPSMHSARWDPSVELRGKRVAVIGTGASAIQIVPALAGVASHVAVVQRTPAWVVPRLDRPVPAWRRALYRRVPGAMRAARLLEYLRYEVRYPTVFGRRAPLRGVVEALVRAHVRREVADPALAAALTPTYELGCKRILVSDDFLSSFNRPDVELVQGAVDAVTPRGVRVAGVEHEADVLIWCTGFRVDDPLGDVDVVGRGGRRLADVWGRRPAAHLGMAVPGFPNAFLLLGPNTALGHNSVVVMIEAQIRWILGAMRWAGEDRFVEAPPEALEAFLADVDRKLAGQVWATGCRSWYLNEDGQNFTIWPGSTLGYLWRTRRFRPY
jgi:cation diffusion facilitator CzcD-associated flavoprotein CzcO